MKVSERSWHLRFARWIHGPGYAPRDLCGYFWRVVFDALSIVALLVVAASFLVSAAILLWWVVANWWRYVLALLFGAETGAIFAGSIILVTGATVAIWKRLRRQTVRQPRPPKPPSLLLTYLKAKKRRVCPLIEVVP